MDIASKPTVDAVSPVSAANGNAFAPNFDAEAVADVIKKKIDTELDGLKPHPPNIYQKILRIAAYPLGLATGWIFGRNEIQEQMQKFMTDAKKFSDLKKPLIENSDSMAEHEAEKSLIIKRWLKMPEERIQAKGFVKEVLSNLERDGRSFVKISPTAKTRVVFATLFGTGASLSLALTLSDNKNFLNFSKKNSNLDKDVSLDR